MSRQQHPSNWPRVERQIKLRAEHRCECGTGYDCGSGAHYRRCPNIEGNRYVHNKRRIALRVVQIRVGNDWRPANLVALCLPCHIRWEAAQKADAPTELEQDGLFG